MGLIKKRFIEQLKIIKSYTWAIQGEIKVASGDIDYICPMFISSSNGAKLVGCRYTINSGTSVTAKLQINNSDVSGFTNINITTTPNSTSGNIQLNNNDKIALVITSVVGTPKNLSFTIFVEYTI